MNWLSSNDDYIWTWWYDVWFMKSSEEKVIFSAFSHCNAFLACFTSKNENTTDSLENNDDFNMFQEAKSHTIL